MYTYLMLDTVLTLCNKSETRKLVPMFETVADLEQHAKDNNILYSDILRIEDVPRFKRNVDRIAAKLVVYKNGDFYEWSV